MTGTTYPPRPTADSVHSLLKRGNLIARRIDELLQGQLLAPLLLTGQLDAIGGTVTYQKGWPTVAGNVEQVAPGAEYPNATLDVSYLTAATAKWAIASEVTDEAIARMTIQPLETALGSLAHQVAKRVDTIAMAAIVSLVTNTFNVTTAGNGGAWTTADNIVASVLKAKATAEESDEGVVFDTIVLRPAHYAATVALLVAGGLFPREEQNPLTTAAAPSFAGLTWRSSVRAPANPLLVDSRRLGAIATENIGGPYQRHTPDGVEVLVDRLNARDSYRIQARKVCAPVILDPTAGLSILGTGLT